MARIPRWCVGLWSLVAVSPLAGQRILETPNGKVQILGLRTWTPERIRDSLHALGADLGSEWCATRMQERFGFASVALNWTHDPRTNEKLLIYTVVERAPATPAMLRRAFTVSAPDEERYAPLLRLWDAQPASMQMAMQTPTLLFGNADPTALQAHPHVAQLRDALVELQGPDEAAHARWVLFHDANPRNRFAASIALLNDPRHDSTFWALADATRDTVPLVAIGSTIVLNSLSTIAARRVDWAPATASLALSLTEQRTIGPDVLLRALTRTGIDSAVAAELAVEGEKPLLARLASADTSMANPVLALLRTAAGRDLGRTADDWQSWIQVRRYGHLRLVR